MQFLADLNLFIKTIIMYLLLIMNIYYESNVRRSI